ncbi:unnamed protein product, partial [Iphiclides podalirius]
MTMRTLLIIYFASLVHCECKGDVKHLRHARALIRHGRSRVHMTRVHGRARDLVAQIEAETSSELGKVPPARPPEGATAFAPSATSYQFS